MAEPRFPNFPTSPIQSRKVGKFNLLTSMTSVADPTGGRDVRSVASSNYRLPRRPQGTPKPTTWRRGSTTITGVQHGSARPGGRPGRAIPDPAAPAPRVRYLDYAPPKPPRWLWDGMIERGTVTVLSGAKSTMKSMLGHGLTAALVLGRECYLGRPIAPGPVLVIDAENPDGVAQDRLGSLGVGPEHWNPELLRYVGRPTERGQRTPRIGDPYWNDWLAREIADFEPALLVVDGSLTATNVRKVSDEDRVEALFDVLRDAIQGHPTAVLLYHHERKPSVEVGRGSAADALIGSVYWTNLPDTGYALARKAQEKTDADDGAGYRLRTISELEVTKEHRRAAPPEPFCWVADTIFDRDGTPRHCEIALTDNPDALIVRDALAEMVSENGAVVKRKDLAAHMGTRSDDTTFDRRLQAALAAGLVVKPEYGKYALPAESHGPALD